MRAFVRCQRIYDSMRKVPCQVGSLKDADDLESFLSVFSSDVCRWLVEYPNAEKYCPTLFEMGLTDPRLLDEALLPDK